MTTDEWIEHDGKIRPVPAGTNVDVRLRNATVVKRYPSDLLDWGHDNDPADIVAYRVVRDA